MKKFFIIISSLCVALSLSSCMKQLDIPQKSVLDLSEFYATAGPEEAEQLIASVEKYFYNNMNFSVPTIFLDVLSDDHLTGGSGFTDVSDNHRFAYEFTLNSTHRQVRDQYNAIYRIIYFCNLILEDIPESSDPTIKKVKTEAEFFRSLCMFEALRWWGTPPLVTKVAKTDEDRYPSNGDPKEIITWCLDRMKYASDNLGAIPGLGQQAKFGARPSKHAALAYYGKMAVWYGTKYNDKEILAKAVEPLKTVVNSGLYELVSDMTILGRKAGDFCSEYVFEHNSADADGYPSNQSHNIQLWYGYRQDFWNLMPVGIHTQGWGFSGPSQSFGDFLKEHEGGVDKPRFMAHIRTYNQLLDLEYADASKKGLKSSVPDNAGYFRWEKLLREDELYDMPGWWKYSMANMEYLKFSEVLLLYAEAQFLVNNDSDGSGLAALNKVRTRAELKPLAKLDYQAIKDERRAELWGQQERFFDLVRWGDAATVLKNKGTKNYTFNGLKADGSFDVTITDAGGKGWDDKYVVFPFPNAQLAANKNLVQNNGW